MIVVLMLGIHFLLITIYAYMVMTKHSRLSRYHLLLAVVLPFVGELCLLASEAGKMPISLIYQTGFKKKTQTGNGIQAWVCPENWENIVLGEETAARDFLMSAIDSESDMLPKILRTGLLSSSSEVSHISASRLMKIQRMHEDTIAKASEASKKNPNNVSLMASYIDSIHAYLSSGVLDEVSFENYKGEELDLLRRYLRIMPSDELYTSRMALLSSEEVNVK